MSAIFGIWNKNDNPVDQSHLYVMRDRISHYGTDSQDVYISHNLALGCCLNKVNKYSVGDQPILRHQDNVIMVADASIYNREELIGQLGLSAPDISNNELLMEAYLRWGIDCPKYMNGDFAFVVWDKDQLIIVRDHLGVRPLYYYNDDKVFAFATDYRALLALPFLPIKISDRRMYDLLINGTTVDKEYTWFEYINKILPAHVYQISQSSVSLKKYWAPASKNSLVFKTEEEYFKALYEVVNKAIEIRLASTDYKIGSEISGGLDSTVVSILANRTLRKENKSLSLLYSWSPPFEALERQSQDERTFIEQICEQEKLECLYFDVNTALAKQRNDDAANMPEARVGTPLVEEFEIAKSRSVRLILTGWGGDEGISHRAGLFELFVNRYWKHYFREAWGLSRGSLLRLVKILISSTILQLFRPFSYFHRDKYSGIIANRSFYRSYKKYKEKTISYFRIKPEKNIEAGPLQTRTELAAWLGADYNVQHLYPFLDYHVIDFAMAIPRDMFYKKGLNRYAYRKAFEGILPKEMLLITSKNDPARFAHSANLRMNTHDEELIMNNLNKDLLGKYIDFEKAQELLQAMKQENNEEILRILKRQLSFCYSIQRLIETR